MDDLDEQSKVEHLTPPLLWPGLDGHVSASDRTSAFASIRLWTMTSSTLANAASLASLGQRVHCSPSHRKWCAELLSVK